MGKTLKYGDFDFPQGNRIAVRPHTSRARSMKKGGVSKLQDGGLPTPTVWTPGMPFPDATTPLPVSAPAAGAAVNPDRVYGALNQRRPETGPTAVGAGPAAQNAHDVNVINAGHAPLTAAGVGAALQNAMNVALGGMAPINAALATGLERGLGLDPGSAGGLMDVPGQHPYTPEEKAFIRAGGTPQQALANTAAQQAARDHEGRAVHGGGGIGGGVDNASHAARAGFRKGGRVGRRRV